MYLPNSTGLLEENGNLNVELCSERFSWHLSILCVLIVYLKFCEHGFGSCKTSPLIIFAHVDCVKNVIENEKGRIFRVKHEVFKPPHIKKTKKSRSQRIVTGWLSSKTTLAKVKTLYSSGIKPLNYDILHVFFSTEAV